MANRAWYDGTHVTSSPSGSLLACVIEEHLRICFSSTPERCIDFPIRIARKDITALRWASDSSRVLIQTASQIEVIDLEDEQSRVRLDNGSAGLGRFVIADFLQLEQILTVWEFGRAKIWNLSTGHSVDIDNIKTAVNGPKWSIRPLTTSTIPSFAYLSRPAADDLLVIHFQSTAASLPPVKLPTIDAKSLHWSPDGHWLAVLDTPRQRPNVHIFTADGHLYKSYFVEDPSQEEIGLGIKSLLWSPNSQSLALTRHDDCIDLISGSTLSQRAIVEHSKIIDQQEEGAHTQVWQENVSASGTRAYKELSMPVSPPLSRSKQSFEPKELGVAEVGFSCNSRYLSSRDEGMLSTIWVWDVELLRPHAVIIQHNNVRRMRWHPHVPDLLMLDCGENIAYLFEAGSGEPPRLISIITRGNTALSFLLSTQGTQILAAGRTGFALLRTDSERLSSSRTSGEALREAFGEEEDSLFEILSGRANHAHPTDLSYTERLEMVAEDNEGTVQIDDTFDGRQAKHDIHDPLDDSEIF